MPRVAKLYIVFALLWGAHLVSAQNGSFSFIYDGPTEIFVGEECMATLDYGHPNTPIAISNVPGGEIESFEILSISGGYSLGDEVPPGAVIMILYEARDNFNNSAIFGFNIYFADDIPPSFDLETLPDDIEVGCISEIPPPAEVTGFDNCMDPEYLFSITMTEVQDIDGCMGGAVTRTWKADDDLGNQTYYTQTITVLPDMAAPVFTTPPLDGSGACEDAMSLYTEWLAEQRANQLADDGGCENLIYIDNAPDAGVLVGFCGDIPVQFTVADSCGNNTTVTATFSILNNIAPTIETQASDGMADCSMGNPESNFQAWINNQGGASAFDDCGSVSWTTNPPNPTLGDTCSNMITIEFIADDGCGNTSSTMATFMAIDTTPPTITNQPQIKFTNCGSDDVDALLSEWLENAGNATAQDLCTQSNDLALGYKIGTEILDTNGVFAVLQDSFMTGCRDGVVVNGILFNDVIALLEIDFVFADACGNTAMVPSKFVVIDNTPPVIDSAAMDQMITCDTSGDLNSAFMEWYSSAGGAQASDGCAPVQWRGEPTFDLALEQLNAALDTSCSLGAVVEVSFFASDVCGNESASTTARFGVMDTLPPVITIIDDTLTISCAQVDSIPEPEVIDDCSAGVTITFQDSTITAGDTTGCGQFQQTFVRTWLAADLCGNEAIATQVIVIDDSMAPTFTVPSDTMVNCIPLDSIASFSFPTNVEDDCDPNPAVTFEDVLNGSGCNFSVVRTWMVSDACGNIQTAVQNITITDSIAPIVIVAPTDLLISCDDTINGLQLFEEWINTIGGATLEDNCSDITTFIAVPGSYVLGDTSTYPGTMPTYSLGAYCETMNDTGVAVALVYYDACLNAAQTLLHYKISDTIAPEWSNCMSPIIAIVDPDSCTADFLLFPPDVEDNCTPTDDLSISYQIDDMSMVELSLSDSIEISLSTGTHAITWFATDCVGNVGTCKSTLTANDVTDPEIECPVSIDTFLMDTSCVIALSLPLPKVMNVNCTPQVTGYLTIEGPSPIDSLSFEIGASGINVQVESGLSIVTYYLNSVGGLNDTCIITLNVMDTIAPVARCKDFTTFTIPTASVVDTIRFEDIDNGSFDGCGVDNFSIVPNTYSCELVDVTIELELTITDEAGNSSSCKSQVEVLAETIVPSYVVDICMPDTLYLFANTNFPDSLGLNYSWAGPNEFTSNEINPVLANIDSSASGTYQLTISGAGGCAIEGMVQVNFESLNQAQVFISDSAICLSETILFISTVYSDSVIYQWSILDSLGMIIQMDSTVAASYIYTPENIGEFGIFVNIIGNGCETGASVTLKFQTIAPPTVDIFLGTIEQCFGDTVLLSAIGSTDSLQYQWSGPAGYASSQMMAAVILIDSSTIGTYYVQATNGVCTSNVDSINVIGLDRPGAASITGDSVVCFRGTLVLKAKSEQDSMLSYAWIGPGGQMFTSITDSIVVEDFNDQDTGIWRVIVNNMGCVSDTSAGFNVQLDPSFELTAQNNGPLCEGDTIRLSAQPASEGDSFQWTGPNSFSSDQQNPIIFDSQQGTYYVTVTTASGCTVMDSTVVLIQQRPVINDISSDFEVCVSGNGTGQLIPVFEASDNAQFVWTQPNDITVSDVTLIIDSLSEVNNGWYQLVISDNGCFSVPDSFLITVTNQPSALNIEGSLQLCEGDQLEIMTNGPIGDSISYLWSTPLGDSLMFTDNIFIIDAATTENSGAYSVVIQIGACTSEISNILNIQVQPAIAQPTIVAPTMLCEGDSLTLSLAGGAVDGASYSWTGPNSFSSASAEPTIFPTTPLASGMYFVSIQIYDCVSPISNAFLIEVAPRPNMPVIESFEGAVCLSAPEPFMLCVSEVSTVMGATYVWTNEDNGTVLGATDARCFEVNDFASFQDGINNISVTTELEGCRSFSSELVAIEMFEFPNEMAFAGDPLFVCVGDEPIVSAEAPAESNGMWSSVDNLIVFDNPASETTLVQGLQEGDNQLIWSLSFEACVNFSSDTVIVSVESLPLAMDDTVVVEFGNSRTFNAILNDQLPEGFTLEIIQNPSHGNTLHQGGGSFVYTPNIGYVGDDAFVYRICSNNCPDQCDDATVFLKVGDDSDCFIPTLFTPNEDGVNDAWIIPCLEAARFPNNRVAVFNEWGDAVFEATRYLNDWRGLYKNKELPVGTYFYVVDFGDGRKVQKGFLILER